MARRQRNPIDKVARRIFNLTNKVGQLGRQGVKGPVERREKKIAGLKPLKRLDR